MFQLMHKCSGKIKNNNLIDENEIILDIGPKTIQNIKKIIDQSNTVLWNGPTGYFENKEFSIGTLAVAKKFQKILLKNLLYQYWWWRYRFSGQ